MNENAVVKPGAIQTVTVGAFSITGTPALIAKISDMAKHVSDVLGDRIKNVQVGFYSAALMPRRADGGPSVGYTPNPHKIMLWQALVHHVPETFAHECCHVLDGQWMTTEQRQDIMALEVPPATKWQSADYDHEGCENFACYGSGALFGVQPAWQRFYLDPVPTSAWPQLAAMALKDYGAPVPVPPPDPTPPDPVDLQAQIDELSAQLTQSASALQSCQNDRTNALNTIAQLNTKIAAAKTALT
jgi:hypothetical protein